MSDLTHAIGAIERRIQLIRLTDDAAEFLTRTKRWVEVTAVPEGWRVRVYYRGRYAERVTDSIGAALDAARWMARPPRKHTIGEPPFPVTKASHLRESLVAYLPR